MYIYIIWYVKNVNTYQIFDNNWHNKGAIPLSSIINEGVLSGNGLSRRNYVWRGFCPRGFCPRGFRPEGVLSAHRSTHMSHHCSGFHTAVEFYTSG